MVLLLPRMKMALIRLRLLACWRNGSAMACAARCGPVGAMLQRMLISRADVAQGRSWLRSP
eukprot:292322-Chlamydomonas_euryale.AAC.11